MDTKKRISIVTVTRWCRNAYIPALYATIVAQKGLRSGSNEWVVVDGSTEDADQAKLQEMLKSLPPSPKVSLRYVSTLDVPPSQRLIGRLREIGNRHCRGQFIVVFDDDDFSHPSRVRSTVAALKKAKLAGCTNHLMLDYDVGLAFQLKGFHQNHAVNCTMAYWKEYSDAHHYDPTKANAEESSFTNNFTEPMVQLDPYETIVQTVHPRNTFGKKLFVLRMLQGDAQTGVMLRQPYQNLVPRSYLDLFLPAVTDSPHAVVFYCGATEHEWHPQAPYLLTPLRTLVCLAKAVAALLEPTQRRVAIYGLFPFASLTHEGVEYIHVAQFRFRCKYHALVLWHLRGVAVLQSPHIQARTVAIDLHTNFPPVLRQVEAVSRPDRRRVVKSAYHAASLKSLLSVDTVHVVPHGQSVATIDTTPRSATRLVYANPYACGLGPLIEVTWPILHNLCPQAELHVCHGLEFVTDETLRTTLEALLQQPGIVHHGRLRHEEVLELKRSAAFDLYYTSVDGEVDLSTLLESTQCGCVPITSDANVFRESPGLRLSLGSTARGT